MCVDNRYISHTSPAGSDSTPHRSNPTPCRVKATGRRRRTDRAFGQVSLDPQRLFTCPNCA